jgi:hypothetical protein
MSVQSLAVPSGEHGPKLALPKGTWSVLEGTDRGLLLFVGTLKHLRLD